MANQIASSAYALRCTPCMVDFLIPSTVMQSGISVHKFIVLMVMCMSGISSSPFPSWLCQDSQPLKIAVALVYIVFWCICVAIMVFYDACLIGLQHLSYVLPPAVCGLWSHCPHGWNSSGEIFPYCEVCLALSFLCCYSWSLHLSGFYVQMLLATGQQYWVLFSLGPAFLPSLAPRPTLTHLFHNCSFFGRMLWLHSSWLCSKSCHRGFGMCCSMSILILMMSGFLMVHIPLELMVRNFPGSSLNLIGIVIIFISNGAFLLVCTVSHGLVVLLQILFYQRMVSWCIWNGSYFYSFNFRFSSWHIYITCPWALSWSLPSALYPKLECHLLCQINYASLWSVHLFSSRTCHLLVLLQKGSLVYLYLPNWHVSRVKYEDFL